MIGHSFKRIGLVNLVIVLALGLAATALAFLSKSLAATTCLVFFGLSFLVCAISYFQMRLEETEQAEKLEFEELNKAKGSASLFSITDAEVFPAQRSREQFERLFVPSFTILLFCLEAAAAYFFAKRLFSPIPWEVREPTLTLAFFALFALILFVVGKYTASRARLEKVRLLRPVATYNLLSSYGCFLVTGALSAVVLGYPAIDLQMARVFTLIIGLAAIETLAGLVLEIYRPRVKGRIARPLYESRVVGLLAQPEGLVTTAAQALDYQFGFNVSETWFYRFLEGAIVWLVLIQVAALWTSTAVVFVGPGEQGLIERFGKPVQTEAVLEPGLHFKMPWPVDKLYRVRTREIQSFNVGFTPDPAFANQRTVLWTVQHYEEEVKFLIASRTPGAESKTNGAPVDLLAVGIPIQYTIKDLRAWAYGHAEPNQTLQDAATREVVRYLIGVNLTNVMSGGRAAASLELRERIQKGADRLGLGVAILFVGLQDIHPPVEIAANFEELNVAEQAREQKILSAQGAASNLLARAVGEATRTVNDAESYRAERIAVSEARSENFKNQMAAYKASPLLYTNLLYLRAFSNSSTNSRRQVISAALTHTAIQYNGEEKIRADLLDVPLPPAAGGR